MRLVLNIIDETAEVYPVAAGQVFKDAESPNLLSLVGRKRNAVTQEKERARLGQWSTNVNKDKA